MGTCTLVEEYSLINFVESGCNCWLSYSLVSSPYNEGRGLGMRLARKFDTQLNLLKDKMCVHAGYH